MSVRGKQFRTDEEEDAGNYHEFLDTMITTFHAPDTPRYVIVWFMFNYLIQILK